MMYGSCRESLKISILLLSSVPLVCGLMVGGSEGESVTLPCTYSVKTSSDITTMCWGRGSCPSSKCTDALIWTDGHKVTYQSSNRYQLNDNIANGQVSLTIAKGQMEDAGIYCCRIEHHGWFNDKKLSIELKMAKAITTPPPVKTIRTTPPPPPVRTTFLPPPPARTTIPPPPAAQTTIPPTPPAKKTSPPLTTAWTTTPPTPPTKSNTPPPPPARTTIQQPIITETATVSVMTLLITEFPSVVTTHETRNEKSTDEYNAETEHVQDSSTEADTPSSIQPTSEFSNSGIVDLLHGNITVQENKERGILLHILIIAISLLLILSVIVPLLVLKCKGKLRRQYILGMDPNLELVTHAEELEATEMERAQADEAEARKTEDTNINKTKD
ncbi:hepatitis A virus cellular receptor 1-like isoform X2 [Pseudophryne corroboree]|uniref:hepatitis A virus cellular receptor 1-like isoform X2 n=1 Tax=Pseudophryne corroboree TaxID=495146 RepID=UPI003081CEED